MTSRISEGGSEDNIGRKVRLEIQPREPYYAGRTISDPGDPTMAPVELGKYGRMAILTISALTTASSANNCLAHESLRAKAAR